MKPHQQRIRDHELVMELYRMAVRWVDLRETMQSPDAEDLRETIRAFAREHVGDRIITPQQ